MPKISIHLYDKQSRMSLAVVDIQKPLWDDADSVKKQVKTCSQCIRSETEQAHFSSPVCMAYYGLE